jgi:hypothetical protein
MSNKTITCHTDLIMIPAAVQGKSYVVVDESDTQIIIRNEQDQLHYFSKNPHAEDYFGLWFANIEPTE